MAENVGRPLGGLALGGGGARGLAHLGVMKVLEREQFPIDLISGTSIGGVVGAVYAHFGSLEQLEPQMEAGLKSAASRYSISTRLEMLDSRPYRRWLWGLFGRSTFADLKLPLALTAVDIDSGEDIVLRRGPVVPAISATSAIPAIYEPVLIRGRRLVDGGLTNPVPVDVARWMGATVVIGIDVLVESDRPALQMPTSTREAALRKMSVMSDMINKSFDVALARVRDYRLRQFPPDLLITPNLRGFSAMNYERGIEAMARGEAAAEAEIDTIRRLRDRLLTPDRAPIQFRVAS